MISLKALGYIGLIASLFTPMTATAQDNAEEAGLFLRNRNISVQQRERPEYEPLGIHARGFRLSSGVDVLSVFNDNIFATNQEKNPDIGSYVRPHIEAESMWSRHALGFGADFTQERHGQNPSENTTDYSLNANALLDIRRGLKVVAGASYSDLTEQRSAIRSFVRSEKPIDYSVANLHFEVEREQLRSRVSAYFAFDDLDFEDGRVLFGTIADQDFRDHRARYMRLKGEYAISPNTAVFARVQSRHRDYKEFQVETRDQSGTTFDVGANFDLNNLVRGEVGVGYLNYTFENGSTEHIRGFSTDMQLEWFPTPLTTLSLSAQREVKPSAILTAPAVVSTGGKLQGDYDVRRNIMMSVGAHYYHEAYRGSTRRDDRASFFLEARYLLNRRLGLSARVSHERLQSTGVLASQNFQINKLAFGLMLRH